MDKAVMIFEFDESSFSGGANPFEVIMVEARALFSTHEVQPVQVHLGLREVADAVLSAYEAAAEADRVALRLEPVLSPEE